MKPINIKINNKTDYKRMAKQYILYYTTIACDWFDKCSGAKNTSVNI